MRRQSAGALKAGRGIMARPHNIMAAVARKERWVRHHADPASWFWKRVDRTGGPDGCWPWLGRTMTSRRGYGRLVFKGRYVGAHRMALALVKGEPPDADMFACHACDNPVCCNPAHLWWGTHDENMADAVAKGRKRGAPRKIDLDECVALRATGLSYAALAERYSVNQASIGKALGRAALKAREASL